MAEEREIDGTSLEAALGDLIKAADAADLIKGGISNTGTIGSDGKQGGGQGSMSDSGKVDDIMYGKMSEAGVPAGLLADFRAFMAGKANGEDDDEDDDEEEEQGFKGRSTSAPVNKGGADKGEPLRKSALEQLREDPDVAEAIDVSKYLEAMTAGVANQLDALAKSQDAHGASQAKVNRALAVAVVQLGRLTKSLAERLGAVEKTPGTPKGRTSGAQPLNKALPGEAGTPSTELSKREILSTLSYMNLEKGQRQINGQKTSEIIALYEGGDILHKSTVDAVEGFLKAHPSEAQVARQYA